MITLTDFLLARIAEDDAGCRAEAAGVEWLTVNGRNLWDQLRAECEAKRRIVSAHVWIVDSDDGQDYRGDCLDCRQTPPCLTLRLLALPHADHADYRVEWKP